MLKSMLFGSVEETAKQWVTTLGGSGDDYGQSVAVASDGSVYVCGYTNSTGAGGKDLLLVKFNSSGVIQWQKTLGGSRDESGYSVAVDPDGSVYVCGYDRNTDSSLLAKFSSSGTVQWQRAFTASGGDAYQSVYSVAVAPDGSVYVCGNTESGSGLSNLLLAKFNSSGTMQWGKSISVIGFTDYGQSVAVASDGSVYVCGNTESYVDGFTNLLLAKFNSSGTVQWKKIIGENTNVEDHGSSVAVAPDGSVYAFGYTTSGSAGYGDFLLAKFSSSGTVQWQKIIGGRKPDLGYSVAVASDGSIYVCGYTGSTGAGGKDLLLVKFSSSGTVQWQKTLGGSSDECGNSVAVAPDGSVYVCGYTNSTGAGSYDLLLAKITDSLIEQDTVTFGNLTFQDASLTAKNVSLTIESDASVSNASLTVRTSSLTVGTPSLTTNLYTYKE